MADLKKSEGRSSMATRMEMEYNIMWGLPGGSEIKVSNGMEFIPLVWLAGCLPG